VKIEFKAFKSSSLAKVFTFVSLIMVLNHFSLAGTASGGGGNLCYINGQPVLLELANYRDRTREEGVKFAASNMTKLFGYSAFTILNIGKIKARVDDILSANEKNSPIMTSWLRKITSQISFSLTSASINSSVYADFSQIPDCNKSNTKASILYFPPLMGFVDLAQFNSLDLDSQAGLILHESARFFQLLIRENLKSTDDQTLNYFTDARLQTMILTLFQVYWGISNTSIDQEELFSAIQDALKVQFLSDDLCLDDIFFQKAKAIIYKQKGISSKTQSKDDIIQFPYEIDDKKNELKAQAPEPFITACRIYYESHTWFLLKKKLLTLKTELNATPIKGFYSQLKMELNKRIERAMQEPTREKSLREKILEAVPSTLGSIVLINAHVQMQLSLLSIYTNNYYEIRDKFFLSKKEKLAIKEIETLSCNSRENLNDWFQHGAPDASESKSISSLLEAVDKPNPKCNQLNN